MAIITTTNLSELEFGNRYDSELYNPNLLTSFSELKKSGYVLSPIGKFCSIKSGTTPRDRDDSLKKGPILFKTKDIRNNVISPYNEYYHISPLIHKRMYSTQIKRDDVLLNIVGATLEVIGRSAIVMDDINDANITQAMVFLRIRKDFKSGFLFTYLNTKYAQDQIKRYARPTGQYNLNLIEVGKILVPKIAEGIQNEIDTLIRESAKLQNLSHTLYREAEELLRVELQLDRLSLECPKCYSATFSEVINNARFDGEYYQPKYKKLMKHLSEYECKPLGKLCDFMKGFEVGSNAYNEEGKLFMRVSNISEHGISTGNSDKYISDSYYNLLKPYHIHKGDILCTKDGTIAMCYVVDEDIAGIFSSGIVRLSLKEDIPAEYLTIVINSLFGKMQANRDCSGALITHWKIEEMKKMRIPIISNDAMQKISDLVVRSKVANQQSKSLLAQAKVRVEELIEQEANKSK